MPVEVNLGAAERLWDQQEVDRFNKLDVYFALQQAKRFAEWPVWNKLLGVQKWTPNQGNTLRGVIVEPSPKSRVFISPNPLTQAAKKDIISQFERTNDAILYHHKFESPQFGFMPSFADFRRNQVDHAQKDIDDQIIYADDVFARGVVFHGSPYVFVSGRAAGELKLSPIGFPSDDGSTGKSTAFLQETVAEVGNNKGNLSFKAIKKAGQILKNDLQAPGFEQMQNVPKDNEVIKGNYVLLCGDEAYENLAFDEHILNIKDLNLNLVNNEFSGKLGNIVVKKERFPIRIAADGTCPVPQTYIAEGAAYNEFETVPNQAYLDAPFEVAHLLADGAWDKVPAGPPPSEFASGKISEGKLNKLKWNGEITITDNILIQVGDDGGTPILDTNKYGEFLQLIAHMTFGAIAKNRRYVMPIIYRRWRVSTT